MEEKANIGADRIKKDKYVGLLYSFCEVATDLSTEDLVFAHGKGPYPHFCTGARITARTPGNDIMANNNSKGVTLLPNTQMDISLYAVGGIFPSDDVLLRVRIEIDPIKQKDFTEVAELTYMTLSREGVLQNYKPVGVFRDTRVLDFGFEMRHLAVNPRNSNQRGETTIRINYESGDQPLKIKCVNVYTKKAIDGDNQATLVTGMKSPTSMNFICETISEENGGLAQGTLP